MAKYPGEMVGGRHIATVANHREVVAERRGGEWVLTFEGEQLAKQLVRGD